MEKQKGFVISRGIVVIFGLVVALLLFLIFTQNGNNQQAQNTNQQAQPDQQTSPEEKNVRTDVKVKDDLTRIAAAVASYANNNSGTYPSDETEAAEVLTSYILDKPFLSPITQNSYTLTLATGRDQGVVNLLRGTCNADKNNTVPTQSTRTYAVLTQLTDKSVYCIDV
jgi:hypothetical protein